MKKTIFVCILCLLLLVVTACSDEPTVSGMRYASGDEMLKHLEGMWVLEDSSENKTYYIFQDNQAYITSDDMYSEAVQKALEQALQNGGLNAWHNQTFETVTKRLYLKDLSIVCDQISMIPEEGLVKLFPGESDEKQIVIRENSVLYQNGNYLMTKLSDTPDFSGEHFASLFDAVQKEFTAPASLFFPSAESYSEVIKTRHPGVAFYKLVHESENSKIYTSDGKATGSDGVYIISNDSLFFSKGKHSEDESAPFYVQYDPTSTNMQLIVKDSTYAWLSDLMEYVEPILKCFPGTLSTSELLSRFESEATVSYGLRSFTITTNGVECIINQSTDNGKETLIRIKVVGDVLLPATCSHNYREATCTTPKTCMLCGLTQGITLNHTFSEATCATAKTCTQCGKKEGSVLKKHDWVYTSCTTNKVCSVCNEESYFSAPGHNWVAATCTEPEYCAVCKETGTDALGHEMLFTQCANGECDYVDYGCIAGTYGDVSGYGCVVGTTTEIDVEATNVSISDSGVLSFTCYGKSYQLTVVQNDKSTSHMAYFNCYLDGVLLEDVVFRAGNQSYYNLRYLDGFTIDNHRFCLVWS